MGGYTPPPYAVSSYPPCHIVTQTPNNPLCNAKKFLGKNDPPTFISINMTGVF